MFPDPLLNIFMELYDIIGHEPVSICSKESIERWKNAVAEAKDRFVQLAGTLDAHLSPFLSLVKSKKLSWNETAILGFLVAEDAHMTRTNPGGKHKGRSGAELLVLLLGGEYSFRDVFYSTKPLLREGLLERSEDSGRTVLHSLYRASEKGIRLSLGHNEDTEDGKKDTSISLLNSLDEEDSEDYIELGMEGGLPYEILTPPSTLSLEDVILPDEMLKAVRTALAQFKNQELIFEKWGFGKHHKYGKGLPMLFSGPPGTGKTYLAQAIASELSEPLMEVSYPGLVSCYVGETAKNIRLVFRMAKARNAVLLWDEADAMFTRRMEAERGVEQAHNRDLTILLKEVEDFTGVVILTTNRGSALDRALERRLVLKLVFPEPDREMRLRIWKKLIPEETPLDGVNLEKLAITNLTGGQIRNVILNAARMGCTRNPPRITQQDFMKAIEMEVEGRGAMLYNLEGQHRDKDREKHYG